MFTLFFFYLTLIQILFLYMVFLGNKNGLLKQTPFCQGGKEASGHN